MEEEWNGLEWAIDVAATAALAGAAGWSALVALGPTAAAAACLILLPLTFIAMRSLPSRGFRLPSFFPEDWDPVLTPAVLELTEPLLAPAFRETRGSGVVRLFPDQPPLPSAGEMRQSIELHLRQRQAVSPSMHDEDVVLLGADASAALRNALRELKRSLG